LSVIDHTQTGAGARALAARLSAPLTDPVKINLRLDAAQHFTDNRKLREIIRNYLKACPDLERALSRTTLNRGGPRDLASIRDGLTSAAKIQAAINLNEAPEAINRALKNLGSHRKLVETLSSALSPDLPFHARDGGFIARGYLPIWKISATSEMEIKR
jgi:DNA mismatch repair protein MutS